MHALLSYLKKQRVVLLSIAVLAVISFIYSTHLSLTLIPKGYDLLFHLGNVFSLQIKSGFEHNTLASFGISPLLLHDYGYGTHLFYPPLAHALPASIAVILSTVGIHSTLMALRLFSLVTIFLSGMSMLFVAKKTTNNETYAFFASLLYISAPYLQMDYYWRGGMASSLCFVFLPLLLLSLYYFTKEKYVPYALTFIASMTLITWTHMITALYAFIFTMIALGVNLVFVKNKREAILSTFLSGIAIGVMTSPFWALLVQQYMAKTHIIFSSDYPFSTKKIAEGGFIFWGLFDIQFDVWKFKIRNLFALFNLINLGFFLSFIWFFKRIHGTVKNKKYLYSLLGIGALLTLMVSTKYIWYVLPGIFAYIQYPHRLLLQLTPIVSILAALPFLLLKKIKPSISGLLGVLTVLIVWYTFVFNNYELYGLGAIDYTTHSIIQAMGVEREYLPVNTKGKYELIDDREYEVLPLTNTESATPSARIIENETPYLLADIHDNQGKQTVFELPRLYYRGYSLEWTPEGSETTEVLPYDQSNDGLITTSISGNGQLAVQYTGGPWYPITWYAAIVTVVIYIGVMIKYIKNQE